MFFSGKRKLKTALKQLTSDDAHTREDGLLALDEFDLGKHPQVGEPLARIAQNEGELHALRAAAAHRLTHADTEAGLAVLQEFLGSEESGLRWRARNILAQLIPDEAFLVRMFREGLGEPDPFARLQACYELAARDPSFDPLPVLAKIARSDDAALKIELVKALMTLPPSEGVLALAASLREDADAGVRSFAEMSAMMLGAS